ncbi:MAG: type II secretion system protein [Phycisphaerae bacterium]
MRNPSCQWDLRRRDGAAAFTLVELVTAASLMTVMMIGVVEIFGIITETASEADAIHFAQQQARAVLDHLDRDVRGMTCEGYLKINRNPTSATVYDEGTYRSDALSFVSIGSWKGAWNPDEASTAAEVLYTTDVKTPTQFLRVYNKTNPAGAAQYEDHRRGVLARATWLMTGQARLPDIPARESDESNAAYLSDLLAGIAPTAPTDTAVWPWSGHTMTCDESLTRVMACCVSEFFVEYWDPKEKKWVGDGGLASAPGSRESVPAIRVTVAIHDPDDRSPPPADTDGSKERFRGYAYQQVFWIGDP